MTWLDSFPTALVRAKSSESPESRLESKQGNTGALGPWEGGKFVNSGLRLGRFEDHLGNRSNNRLCKRRDDSLNDMATMLWPHYVSRP